MSDVEKRNIMIEKTLATESGIVHYWISDDVRQDRNTLVFLHGLTASHDLFVNQTDYFSKDYNIISHWGQTSLRSEADI